MKHDKDKLAKEDEEALAPIYLVNRNSVIIKPKQPYLDWLNKLNIPDLEVNLEELRRECTAVLIPEVESEEDAFSYLENIFEDLFEMELAAWCQDDAQWPQPLTWQLFNEWFDLEIHSMVIDIASEDLKKEEFL